jgi:hypothetical protein
MKLWMYASQILFKKASVFWFFCCKGFFIDFVSYTFYKYVQAEAGKSAYL